MKIRDLSLNHEPIGQLLQTPPPYFELTAEQIQFYRDNGYVAGIKLLTNKQLELLRDELIELTNPVNPARELFYEYNQNESADPNKVLFHALGAWRVAGGFHDILWHPVFTKVASQLLDGPVRFWHDQIFYKPAQHGGIVLWHQDYSYWTRTKPLAHLSCWIGLDDSTSENGCLHYIPGSHKWNLLPRIDFANDMNAILELLSSEQREQFKPIAIELKQGECSFHHPLMVHGSFDNRSERPRRAMVLNVFRDGVLSDSDQPLLEGVPAIPKGTVMGGRFFPLLSHPEHE